MKIDAKELYEYIEDMTFTLARIRQREGMVLKDLSDIYESTEEMQSTISALISYIRVMNSREQEGIPHD